ncbi:hypothetical protein MTO96_048084 [Rhipicephalus appendiculatus]
MPSTHDVAATNSSPLRNQHRRKTPNSIDGAKLAQKSALLRKSSARRAPAQHQVPLHQLATALKQAWTAINRLALKTDMQPDKQETEYQQKYSMEARTRATTGQKLWMSIALTAAQEVENFKAMLLHITGSLIMN